MIICLENIMINNINILNEKELEENSVIKNYLTTASKKRFFSNY